MQNHRMESATSEIEFLRRLSYHCPLYFYELNSLRRLASMIIRHGGDLSHPVLCKKNHRVDQLYLIACKNLGWLPIVQK